MQEWKTSLKRHNGMSIRRAAKIQFLSKYASIAVSLVITAVLARLITPEAFGLLAIVVVFTSFFNLFSDMGIGIAIVQFRELSERDFGKLFTFSLLLAVLLVAIFCLLSIPISLFYSNQELVPLLSFASISLFFNTINMVPNGLLLRNKDFGSIGLRLLVSTFVSGLTGIIMALAGFGCYALISQIIIQSCVVFFWNILRRPVRYLSIHFIEPLRRIFSYSAFQMGFSIVNYFSRNLDNLVIGKAMGINALGYYDKAYKLTTYPLTAFSGIIGSVVQPFMAEHQDNPQVIFSCWEKLAKLLSLIGAILTGLFFCSSKELVVLFYGSQWNDSVILFHILSISVYFQMVNNISGAFFQSLGRTDLMFKCGLVTTGFSAMGLVYGIAVGTLEALCCGITIAYALHTIIIAYYLLCRGMQQSILKIKVFLPEILICSLVCLFGQCLGSITLGNMVLDLVVKSIVVCSIFAIGYWIFGQIKYFRLLFKK